MPELFENNDVIEEETEDDIDSHIIPTLFPSKLLDICLNKVQEMVFITGVRVEGRARRETDTQNSQL